uniref:NADH dehydrogenase subunit 6 n=1 Tax=Ampittia subvittatus TaxID=2573046 RepID=UPI0022FDA2F0|nr:NADH dehydrogenase subunit 6 [Ampittia subvittatus]WAW79833.1 NADH dehydrogenase subunit 6 [Ampittia subvittatus]
MMFLFSNMLMISFIMIFLKHPISMGFMILIQTMLICMISGMIIYTYWFSYILFLTFLGGLLVLFIYISSIASNELFIFPKKMKKYFLFILIFPLLMMLMNMLKNNLFEIFINNEMNNFFNYFIFFNNEYNINLSKLYNKHNYFLMFMLIIYLFISLVAIVKITNIFYGPLRSFN